MKTTSALLLATFCAVGLGAQPACNTAATETNIIDCSEAELKAAESGLSIITVVDDVKAIVDAAATGGITGAVKAILTLVGPDGADLLACVVDNELGSGAGSGSAGSGSATPTVALASQRVQLHSALLQALAPGKKILHNYKRH